VLYDLLVERPLGLVAVASGLGITTVAYPIAAAANEGDLVVEHCVRTPTRSTFTRALGRLDDDRRSRCSPVAFGFEMTQLSIGAALRPLMWIFGGSPFGGGSPPEDGIEI
jgi:ferredoxin-NADP reductase